MSSTGRKIGDKVTDDDVARSLGAGHPKSGRPVIKDMPGGPGEGSAPGASGPPTTGASALYLR
jgi:hypothetical protein